MKEICVTYNVTKRFTFTEDVPAVLRERIAGSIAWLENEGGSAESSTFTLHDGDNNLYLVHIVKNGGYPPYRYRILIATNPHTLEAHT